MNIVIKEVSEQDWDFILTIRNQHSSRIAFHDTTVASSDTHEKYMKKYTRMRGIMKFSRILVYFSYNVH